MSAMDLIVSKIVMHVEEPGGKIIRENGTFYTPSNLPTLPSPFTFLMVRSLNR